MSHPPLSRRARGFTLIELMIAVVVVGILTAVAVPSYKSYLVKSRRSSAQGFLMEVAQRQQQYLLDSRGYAASLAALSLTTSADVANYYTVTMTASAATPPAFSVTAAPKSGTPQSGDATLTLDHTGAKTPAGVW